MRRYYNRKPVHTEVYGFASTRPLAPDVAAWLMNEGEGNGNVRNYVRGTDDFTTAAWIPEGLHFSSASSSYMSADISSIQMTQSFLFRIRMSAGMSRTATQPIIDVQSGRLAIRLWTNFNDHIYLYDGATRNSNLTWPDDGAWHDLIVTCSNVTGKAIFYLDGQASNEVTYTPRYIGGTVRIGGTYSGSPYFTGDLSHAAIWSRALTPAEVAAVRALPFSAFYTLVPGWNPLPLSRGTSPLGV